MTSIPGSIHGVGGKKKGLVGSGGIWFRIPPTNHGPDFVLAAQPEDDLRNPLPTKTIMIFSRFRILTVALLFAAGGDLLASNRWETLQAINWVENPRNSPKPGASGELGPYQFREKTWGMHTKKPFHLAVQREHADEVAVIHYEWLRTGLIRNDISPTPFNIAQAWNAGLSAVINGRVGHRTRGYARQVVNLVEELNRNQTAALADN